MHDPAVGIGDIPEPVIPFEDYPADRIIIAEPDLRRRANIDRPFVRLPEVSDLVVLVIGDLDFVSDCA